MFEQFSRDDKINEGPLTAQEMRFHLREMFAQDQEASMLWQIGCILRDPLKKGKEGHYRINPIWLELGVLAALMLGTFLYFSFTK